MTVNATEHGVAPAGRTIPRRYVALGLIVLAIILLGALVWIRNDTVTDQSADSETFMPAPSSLVQSVTTVPTTLLNAVGVTSPGSPTTPPAPTNSATLWEGSSHGVVDVPVVFFYGAEFAPYAASERWPLVVALARFGTFGQLGIVQSSTTVAFSNLSTFTFWHATYSSIWLDLQTVERYGALNLTGAGYTSLQEPTARQAAAVAAYDANATMFPLLDIANHYSLVGSSFMPSVLAGLSQTTIAADLAYPTSPVAQAVLASANEITAAICTVTGQRPAAVCGARGVVEADALMKIERAEQAG